MRRRVIAVGVIVAVGLLAFLFLVPIIPMSSTHNFACVGNNACKSPSDISGSASYYYFKVGAIYYGCGSNTNLYQVVDATVQIVNAC